MQEQTFDSLLKDLSLIMRLPDLESTINNNITLEVPPSNILITLQKHTRESILIISSDIIEILGGRFRENVLKEALRHNGQNKLHAGIFGFSKKSQKLILFETLSLEFITPELTKDVLYGLVPTINLWKESLEKGEIPTIETLGKNMTPSGIFGIKP